MVPKKQKIENILNSIDGIEKAEPRPFFFGRLQERMKDTAVKSSFVERFTALVARPSIAFAAIIIIVFVNVFVVLNHSKSTQSNTATSDLATIDEYSQLNTAFFESEKLNP